MIEFLAVLICRFSSDKSDSPRILLRVGDQNGFLEGAALRSAEGLGDLFGGPIDRACHRYPRKNLFAKMDKLTPEKVGHKEAEEVQRYECDDEPQSWNMNGQVCVKEGGSKSIEEVEENFYDIEGG